MNMQEEQVFDVIVIGGSYAGISAAMAIGRASKTVLIIDSGLPCNRQTPYSHNFLSRDGQPPQEISDIAYDQLLKYPTVKFLSDSAITGRQNGNSFDIQTASGKMFGAGKLVFATGIRDILPDIDGVAECWGISAIHCPFCHGYEVSNERTGILANGEAGFEMAKLIFNWSTDLTLYTNGPAMISCEQRAIVEKHQIKIIEKEIGRLEHQDGYLKHIIFKDNSMVDAKALYIKAPFDQQCNIPAEMGCELTDNGYIKIDSSFETTVKGAFACGDNAAQMRSVANAVGMGNAAGIIVSKQIIFANF